MLYYYAIHSSVIGYALTVTNNYPQKTIAANRSSVSGWLRCYDLWNVKEKQTDRYDMKMLSIYVSNIYYDQYHGPIHLSSMLNIIQGAWLLL